MVPSDPRKKPELASIRTAKQKATERPRATCLGSDDDEESTVADPNLQRRMKALADPEESDPSKLKFPVPEGWGTLEMTNEEFWGKVVDLEKARLAGGDALDLALSAYALQSFEHFVWLRERFEAKHSSEPEFGAARKKVMEQRK